MEFLLKKVPIETEIDNFFLSLMLSLFETQIATHLKVNEHLVGGYCMNSSGISVKSENETMNAIMQKAPVMSFYCRDIGMDCSFEAHGSTKHELMRKFIDHAESAHNIQVLPADIILNVHNAIAKNSFD
jgi:predicted small metal-binding protein